MWIITTLLIIIAMYIFLICPSLRKHPDSEICKNLYVAHRGLHDKNNGIPENSIKSFKNAMEKGFAIEIDIHLTKDGKVVIFHDDTLKRVCGKEGRIEELTYKELSEYRLLNTEEKIPLLTDLLEICTKDTVLVIEFKCTTENYEKLCVQANKILSGYNVKYIVQSFNPLAMGWYKKNRKDICRGQLASNFFKDKHKNILEILCGYLLLNFLSRPDFISYNVKYTNNLSRRICIFLGAISAGWTIREEAILEKYKNRYGIYIFENFIPEKEKVL